MYSFSTELDSLLSLIALERNEYVQQDLIRNSRKILTGFIMLKDVEEYGNDATYDAIIQDDTNGELLKLIGLYMSAPTTCLANEYAKCVLERLIQLLTNYWNREVEDAIEEKITYFKDCETKEDEAYETYRSKGEINRAAIY